MKFRRDWTKTFQNVDSTKAGGISPSRACLPPPLALSTAHAFENRVFSNCFRLLPGCLMHWNFFQTMYYYQLGRQHVLFSLPQTTLSVELTVWVSVILDIDYLKLKVRVKGTNWQRWINLPPLVRKGLKRFSAYQLSSCRAVYDLDTVCDGAASLGVHRAPRFPPCCLRDADDALVCFPPGKTTFSRHLFVFPGPRSYFYCRHFNGHKR